MDYNKGFEQEICISDDESTPLSVEIKLDKLDLSEDEIKDFSAIDCHCGDHQNTDCTNEAQSQESREKHQLKLLLDNFFTKPVIDDCTEAFSKLNLRKTFIASKLSK